MKKRIIYFLILVTLFCSSFGSVKAEGANADDYDPNGPGGGQVGGACLYDRRDLWCNRWKSVHMSVAIVYYDGKKNNDGTPTKPQVVGNMQKYYYLSDMWGGDGDANCLTSHTCGYPSHVDETRRDANGNVWKHPWMSRGEDGKVVLFSSEYFHYDTVRANSSDLSVRKATFRNYVKHEFGYDIDADPDQLFVKESCEVDVNNPGNCYGKPGYRLRAEIHGLNGSGHSKPLQSIDYWGGDLNGPEMRDASNSMTVEWPDINYGCSSYGTERRGNGVVCKDRSRDNLNCLRNRNCGWGIWLVDISKYIQPGYDYSLDMACVNCDSTLSDSKAVVLQDTTNWEAIEASPRMTGIKNAPTYFYKSGYGTFCREEYHFFFPNQNDKIKVQLGRYFTLNAKQEDLNVAGADIPNFKPIKVKKIRQCRKGDLSKFNNDSFANFKSCAPDIEVYYKNENVYEYNKDCSKKLEKYTV